MDQTVINSVLEYVQINYLSLIAAIVVAWVSLTILGAALRSMIALIGWFGGYVVAAIPGAIVYAINHFVFNIQTDEATMQAGVAALLVGTIGQAIGRR